MAPLDLERKINTLNSRLATALFILAALFFGGAFTSSASATLPGKNGPLLVNSFTKLGAQTPGTVVSTVTEGGKITPIYTRKGLASLPNLSPNGKRIVFQGQPPANDLFTGLVAQPAKIQRITDAPKTFLPSQGIFAADGRSVFYSTTGAVQGGAYKTFIKRYFFATGKTRVYKVASKQSLVLTDVSPNGRLVALTMGQILSPKVVVLNLMTGKLKVVKVGFPSIQASFAPGGKRLAFAGFRGQNWDIFVSNLGGKGLKQLTNDNWVDSYPVFSPDGRKVALTRTDGTVPKGMRVIDIQSGKSRELKSPKKDSFVLQWLPR